VPLRRLAEMLGIVLVVVGAFFAGHSMNPTERRITSVVQYQPVVCDCSPDCRVSGPNGLYLDLMKLSLTDLLYETDGAARASLSDGRNWPSRGLTMIGMRRLDNLQALMDKTLVDGVPGDYIEAGAWRGGACIFMRSVLEAHGVKDRSVWVADSFEGLPIPRDKLPEERSMAVSLEVVQDNFRRYGLLDGQVRFLKGWFKDTLHVAPISKLAILRVDADMYESTTDALVALYDKVSPGGYVIIDDYGYSFCAKAVEDFRSKRGITVPLTKIDWTGVYWQKPGASSAATPGAPSPSGG
jgi:O-methyltransferase